MIVKIFDELNNDSMIVRNKVFVEEQGFVDEFDDIDKIAIHIIFYDEQPIDIKTAMRQRIRWSKGHIQAFLETGPKLFCNIFYI